MILVIMCIKYIMADRFSVKWHYYIWFLLIIRLVIPMSIPSSLSIYNLVDIHQKGSVTDIQGGQLNRGATQPTDFIDDANAYENMTGNIERSPQEISFGDSQDYKLNVIGEKVKGSYKNRTIDIKTIIFSIWLIGMCIIGIMILKHNLAYRRKIANGRPVADQTIIDMLVKYQKQLGIKTAIDIRWVNGIHSPAITGMRRPIILLPMDYEEERPWGLHYILLHELLHFKRKDIVILRLLVILQMIYWFNPLIWIGFSKMREEMEICCDAGVIHIIGDEHRGDYSRLIVGLLGQNVHMPQSLPALSRGHKTIKTRIISLMKKKRVTKYAIILGVLTSCLIFIFFMTDRKDTRSIEQEKQQASIVDSNETSSLIADGEASAIGIIGGQDGPTAVFISKEVEPASVGELPITEIELVREDTYIGAIQDAETIRRVAQHLDQKIAVRSDMGAKNFYDTIGLMKQQGVEAIKCIIDYRYSGYEMKDKDQFKGYRITLQSANLEAKYILYGKEVMFSNLTHNIGRDYNYNIPLDIKTLVDKYNLNIGYFYYSTSIRLPESFNYVMGEEISSLYWAYRNECMKDIGLDITEYLGKEIILEQYTLDDMPRIASKGVPNRPNRLNILRYKNKFIGAYAENHRYSKVCFSLKEKTFHEVTNLDFDKWVMEYLVITDEVKKLADLEPEEVIVGYYGALEKSDYSEADKYMNIAVLFDQTTFLDNVDIGYFQYLHHIKLQYYERVDLHIPERISFKVDLSMIWTDNEETAEFKKFVPNTQSVKYNKNLGYKVTSILGSHSN